MAGGHHMWNCIKGCQHWTLCEVRLEGQDSLQTVTNLWFDLKFFQLDDRVEVTQVQ